MPASPAPRRKARSSAGRGSPTPSRIASASCAPPALGIKAVAKRLGIGVGTVQRVDREMRVDEAA